MSKVIINADDFGINEIVTSEIERMIGLGAISSTTVMANGKCLSEVKRFAQLHPEVSFGMHLCLSEFSSLTKSEGLFRAGITDENGIFRKQAIFCTKGLDEPNVQQSIRDELNAQIDVISSLGFPVSHVDSHHHVHTIYPLRELFADVLLKRGIKKIRIGADFRTIRMRAHVKLWIDRNRLNNYYKSRFLTTDYFFTYSEFVNAGCPFFENKIIELMCHPGHHGESYKNEIKLVENKVVEQKNNIIISYHEL